tara:strand:+ start:238 stop:495 length:258 start_codon:yes stop_codon:yes gene_type:complete
MPIYKYKCKVCDTTVSFMHSSSETRLDCEECESENSLVRLLARPIITKKNNKDNPNVGDVTKKFIEENRDILNKQKQEYSSEQYD